MIDIANNLGLEVVAEGVEDFDQLRILQRYKCDTVQGYVFSAPVNVEKISQLLAQNHRFHTRNSNVVITGTINHLLIVQCVWLTHNSGVAVRLFPQSLFSD